MVLAPNSSLRKIPAALDRTQAFFVESIRVSLEIIDLAHGRMQAALFAVTNNQIVGKPPDSGHLTSAILDAWSMVDSVHRLCELIEHFPNLQHRTRVPVIRELFAANRSINELRNAVQHLPGHIREMTDVHNWSAWGILTWCVPLRRGDEERIYTCLYSCGRMETGQNPPFVNPIGKTILLPVGQITLMQARVSVCLSDVFQLVEKFTTTIEQSLAETYAADPRLGETLASGIVLMLAMKLNAEPAIGS